MRIIRIWAERFYTFGTQLTIILICVYDFCQVNPPEVSRTRNMYICICSAVTESAIRRAVREGARSVYDLTARTGCSTQCGRCADLARELLEEELASMCAAAPQVHLRVVATS